MRTLKYLLTERHRTEEELIQMMGENGPLSFYFDGYETMPLKVFNAALNLAKTDKHGMYWMTWLLQRYGDKNLTDQQRMAALNLNPKTANFIGHGSDEVKQHILIVDPSRLRGMRDVSHNLMAAIVKHDPKNISYIPNPPEDVQKLAVEMNPHTIQYIEHPTKEVCKIAVEKDHTTIRYLNDSQIDNYNLRYLKYNPSYVARSDKKFTDDELLYAFSQMEELAFEYMKHGKRDINKNILKKLFKVHPDLEERFKHLESDYSLGNTKPGSEERYRYIAAVVGNHIQDPVLLFKKRPELFELKDPLEKTQSLLELIQGMALERDPGLFLELSNPSVEQQKKFLKQHGFFKIRYIKHLTKEVAEFAYQNGSLNTWNALLKRKAELEKVAPGLYQKTYERLKHYIREDDWYYCIPEHPEQASDEWYLALLEVGGIEAAERICQLPLTKRVKDAIEKVQLQALDGDEEQINIVRNMPHSKKVAYELEHVKDRYTKLGDTAEGKEHYGEKGLNPDQIKVLRWMDKNGKTQITPKELKTDFTNTPTIQALLRLNNGKAVSKYDVKDLKMPEQDKGRGELWEVIKNNYVLENGTNWRGAQVYFEDKPNKVFIMAIDYDKIEPYVPQTVEVDDHSHRTRNIPSILHNYMENSGHPASKTGKLMLGWVRYTEFFEHGEKIIWIDEVQTDLMKKSLFGGWGDNFRKVPQLLLKEFIREKRRIGVDKFYMPTLDMKHELYGAHPPAEVYTNLPKEMRFHKGIVTDKLARGVDQRQAWVLENAKYTFKTFLIEN